MSTYRVGVTGGIGSGKSTLCRIMEDLGAPVFYADKEAQVVLNSDEGVKSAIIELFGASVYVDGVLDRKALGSFVFDDKERLAKLNSIMRPVVQKRFLDWSRMQAAPYAMIESALLINGGDHPLVDYVVVVAADRGVRLRRAMARDGSTKEQIEARMAAQMDQLELLKHADHIMNNDGGPDGLRPHAEELHRRLLAKSSPSGSEGPNSGTA